MRTAYRTLLAFCLVLCCCGAAWAEPHTGPYVGGFFGGNLLMNANATDPQGSFGLEYRPAAMWGAVLGWDLGPDNPLGGEGRVELEYSRRSTPLDQVGFAEGKVPGSGDLTVDSLLVNFIGVGHDDSAWAPYILLGLGAARSDASGLRASGQPLATDTATLFAYQAGIGVDYALSDHISFDLGYRFFGTTPPKFTETNGQRFETDYFSHSLMLGMRVGF